VPCWVLPRSRSMRAARCRKHTLTGRRLPIAPQFPAGSQVVVRDGATWVGRKFEKAATASARAMRARLYSRMVCWMRTALWEL
jgi:hypothetical protein